MFFRTIERLKGTAAKELFKMPEEDLVTRLGEAEGKRLANELEAQIGAQTVGVQTELIKCAT